MGLRLQARSWTVYSLPSLKAWYVRPFSSRYFNMLDAMESDELASDCQAESVDCAMIECHEKKVKRTTASAESLSSSTSPCSFAQACGRSLVGKNETHGLQAISARPGLTCICFEGFAVVLHGFSVVNRWVNLAGQTKR